MYEKAEKVLQHSLAHEPGMKVILIEKSLLDKSGLFIFIIPNYILVFLIFLHAVDYMNSHVFFFFQNSTLPNGCVLNLIINLIHSSLCYKRS